MLLKNLSNLKTLPTPLRLFLYVSSFNLHIFEGGVHQDLPWCANRHRTKGCGNAKCSVGDPAFLRPLELRVSEANFQSGAVHWAKIERVAWALEMV